MAITATFLACAICVKACYSWGKREQHAWDMGRPTVGLHGMLVGQKNRYPLKAPATKVDILEGKCN